MGMCTARGGITITERAVIIDVAPAEAGGPVTLDTVSKDAGFPPPRKRRKHGACRPLA